MNIKLNINDTIFYIILFTAIGIFVDTIEKIFAFKEYQKEGFLSWTSFRTNKYFSHKLKIFLPLLDIIFSDAVWLAIIFFRLFCATLILFVSNQAINISCIIYLLFSGGLVNLRHAPFGAETQNRFSLTILLALLIAHLLPTPKTQHICIWFIALQLCFTYFTAGIYKIKNNEWKNGNGFINVVQNTQFNLSKGIVKYFTKHLFLGKLINWNVIIIECLFPLVIFLTTPFHYFFLTWGLLFHLLIAFFLRINKFMWIWFACYPSILYLCQ